jgi:putative membrane-bound dehydrogenase-like protein
MNLRLVGGSLVRLAAPFCLTLLVQAPLAATDPAKLSLLFLGDNGHHRPAERFRQLQPVLASHAIDVTYTDQVGALNAKTLARYDGLIVYANIDKIAPEQEQALLDFVAGGKGFIPIHCASYCFLNSPKYVELVGAQFQKHGTGVFRTTIAERDHPIMKGFPGFESWDETYVHQKHSTKDRIVLEYRVDKGTKEPWTWVRTHGKGRVFYTAWGHDERTWGHPGFQTLIERGIRWAVGADPGVVAASDSPPEMTPLQKDVKPFQYVDANVPFYPPSTQWGKMGEPIKKMQLPLDPAESMKHMVHPIDFELKLFASEPQLGGKPICMNWDERGRLWVALTVDYPNELQPEGQGRDKIVICEDTDGDGKADKFTVFADKLSIPTSMVFYKGGVIVQQAPHTLYLKANKGGDVADERRVLFTGWSTRDTHAGPSNLHWGLDNWVWGIVGYSGFNGTVGGEQHRFSQGFYRFKPDGSKLEFLRSTNNNSWGVGFSEEGLVFGSTANGNPSVYLPIPNRYYEAVRGWSASVLSSIAVDARFYPITDKVRQVDWHGRFTAGAGHALYTARTYPREYWNRAAFVSDPTGHLTATFLLQRNGSDFSSRNSWNLLASDDEWAAPIMAEVGPDGNVWIIDWYNFIVQHNPTPAGFKTGKGGAYETDLRDKKHGRIYRLICKNPGAPGPQLTSLKDATPDQLVAALRQDNMFWRKHAQRLLVERGNWDVIPRLIRLVSDPSVDDIGLNPAAIHALWTMHGLGALDGAHPEATAAVVAALRHKSAGVRRNAVAVLPRDPESLQAILQSGVLEDPDAQVRLAALLALAEMPANADAAAAVLHMLERPENAGDRWIPDAATCAAAAHDLAFLKLAARRAEKVSGPFSARAKTALGSAVAKAEKGPDTFSALNVIARVAEHYARGGPSASIGDLLVALADSDAKAAEIILAGLSKGWPKNHPAELAEANEDALAKLLPKLSPAAKGQLLRLATLWGSRRFEKDSEAIAQSLLTLITDVKQSDDQRIAAAGQLVEFQAGDPQLLEKLLDVISPRTSPQLAAGIIEAVGASQTKEVGPALLRRLGSWSPSTRAVGLRVLLSQSASTRALLDAVDKGQLQLSELTLDQKQALADHPDKKIALRARRLLERGGGLPNPDRQKVVDQLLPQIKRHGDAALGKAVFKNQCAKCHMHSGEGSKIGPDLTGVAVHTKEHLLIDILDPSRSVEGNYREYVVATKAGIVRTGLLSSESKTAVEILDAEGKTYTILREDIEDFQASTKSLMPEGFEKQISADDIVNLLEFLTQRGKYLPLPLDKAATIVSTRGMFYSQQAQAERLIFRDWSPKTFEGIPFHLVDPKGDRVPNVILLNGPNGQFPPKMPKSVMLPCNAPAKAVHLLSGVSGWGFPGGTKGSVSMIVRLHYADGTSEDHPLLNGVHFADYITVVDVPESKLAFKLRGQQIRYLAITPKRPDVIERIELVKGTDATAPVVMAVTVEGRE